MSLARPVVAADLPALRELIDATGLFPSEMLPDMMAVYLAGGSAEIWLTIDQLAVAYCGPERMTQGTFNLLLLATHPKHQRQGHASRLLQALETKLREQGHHLLLVETSAHPEYEAARSFYTRNHFELEATIRDFYQPGENKLIYRKPMNVYS